MNILSIMKLASNVAKLSEHKQKMSAIIVKNGNIISTGINKVKSNPSAWHTGLHAEMTAIKCSGKYDLQGSNIFVYRQKRNGQVGLARPCKYCLEVLREKKFKYIYYTTNEFPFWEMEKI